MGAEFITVPTDEGASVPVGGTAAYAPAQEGLMHVRYAHNTREHLGRDRAREEGGYDPDAHLTLATFLLCPRPAEYLVSPVAQGRPHSPANL